MPSFPPILQDRLNKYLKWEDAQATMLGRKLLKYGLEHFFNYRLDYGDIGYTKFSKPYLLQNKNIHFNISHSGEWVICAMGLEQIGVDIEKVNEMITIDDFRNQMTDYEYKNIFSPESNINKFYDWWSQKEAVVKLLGAGLSIPFYSFEVKNLTCDFDKRRIFIKRLNFNKKYYSSIATFKAIPNDEIFIQEVNPKKFFVN